MRHAAAIVALLAAAPSPARPPRIVSLNPCVDAVLMRVADPRSIVGLSHYSQDPRATSVPLAWARRFHATSGTAEEVVALRPDIVLSGPHVSPATLAALARMRIRLVKYPVAESVEESLTQVEDIARQVGRPDAGQALAREIARAARPVTGARVPALIWQGGGLVPGSGTLADTLLTRAGFRNMSAVYGLKKWDVLPLEYLVARPPRVLLSLSLDSAGGDRMTRHPAVRRLARRIRLEPYPTRLMNCGGPAIIEAMGRLKAIRRSVGA